MSSIAGSIEVVTTPTSRGLLIAAEGLDGSGKSAGLDALGRWLERKGRQVHLVPWERSKLIVQAAAEPRGRQVLTSRVAALLGAAEAANRLAREVRRRLDRGDVVLADRYVWTAVAREVARGVDPDWVAAVYRFAPPPDLVIFHRQDASAALTRALATRPSPAGAEAVGAAYAGFLDRLIRAYEWLLAGSSPDPWTVRTLVVDADLPLAARFAVIREAIRPMLEEPARFAAAR
jgi:thymidylate kinase